MPASFTCRRADGRRVADETQWDHRTVASNPAVPGSRPGGRTISTLGKGLGWGGLAIGHEVAKRGMFHFGATNSAHEPTGRV